MNITRTVTQLLIGALLACPAFAPAEDTDLFLGNPEEVSAIPNVLILLDNTANWNTPFTDEKAALETVLGSLSGDFNVGLMMFTETGGGNSGDDGGYIRYAVRHMCDTPACDQNYKAALTGMVNGLHKLNDKSNGGKVGKTMYEAYLYFNGGTAYAGDTKVKRDYAGNTVNNPLAAGLPGNAFSNADSHSYVTPLDIDDVCANNYIIYISNGPAQDNAADTTTATTQLSAVGGNTSSITISPNGSQSNVGDEWARFLASHDVQPSESVPGNQYVFTYTLDILPSTSGQGPGWSALLKSMASQGNGKYYKVDDIATLQDDLTDIFNQIQAANSVFASSTLPVSANVRGAYLNQVYMGVFRPDQFAKPHWVGNMKQYKIAKDNATGDVFLADKMGVAVENINSGFIVPGAISFWTSSSTFWNFKPSGIPPSGSDSPDGAIVEKGGAAQRLRTTTSSGAAFTFVPGNRHLYTCTGSCTTNSLLSATPFNTSNVSQAALGAADATEQTNIVNWMLGYDNMDEDGDSVLTDVRPSIHGDVVHSRPAAVNYGGATGVVLFYGTNEGVFRAVKGGQAASDGVEKWGFVPSEFFGKLKRQRDNDPEIDFYPEPEPRANGKPYFADGPVGVYRNDANNDGEINGSDKVYIYISLRRGGRMLYALDVTNPDTPKFLWKKSNANYPELGQTWSEPKVAAIKAHANPVLIFAAGYDESANAAISAASATMGRGVFILDATDGSKVWMAGQGADADVTPAGMNYSITADVAVLDRDGDGKADRLYAPDVAGNIWRIDIDASNKLNWVVNKFAAVGGGRRFLFPVDVVYAYPARNYDAILIGSGDREHPFDTTITNRFYMFKDMDIGKLTNSDDPRATITEDDLYDATANLVQVGSDAEKKVAQDNLDLAEGWYVTLTAGEKAIGGSLTLFGTTYFGTHKPAALAVGTCSNLGEARGYALSFSDASATIDYNQDDDLTTIDRNQVFAGGGFLPSPIYGNVDINGDGVADTPVICQGEHCESPEAIPLGERFRTYWFQEIDR